MTFKRILDPVLHARHPYINIIDLIYPLQYTPIFNIRTRRISACLRHHITLRDTDRLRRRDRTAHSIINYRRQATPINEVKIIIDPQAAIPINTRRCTYNLFKTRTHCSITQTRRHAIPSLRLNILDLGTRTRLTRLLRCPLTTTIIDHEIRSTQAGLTLLYNRRMHQINTRHEACRHRNIKLNNYLQYILTQYTQAYCQRCYGR